MSTHAQVNEWSYSIRNSHQGDSILALFLVPSTGYTVTRIDQEPVQGTVYLITPIPDGAFIPDGVHNFTFCVSTPSGLVTSFLSDSTPLVEDKFASKNIPQVLREITNLPVEILASLVNVSRNAYYKWLDGKGVSDEHKSRLTELLDTFLTLQDLLGSDLKEFLETPGPAGRPVDLLAERDSSAVIRLALSPHIRILRPEVSHRGKDK